MTPAEELREAAKLIRERAEAATVACADYGRWNAHTNGSWAGGETVLDQAGHPVAVLSGPEDLGAHDIAEHIAGADPAFMLAVAEWLAFHAKRAEADLRQVIAIYGTEHGPEFARPIDEHALTVARKYLRSES